MYLVVIYAMGIGKYPFGPHNWDRRGMCYVLEMVHVTFLIISALWAGMGSSPKTVLWFQPQCCFTLSKPSILQNY